MNKELIILRHGKTKSDHGVSDIDRRLTENGISDAYNMAELGIGTNDQAIVTGMILEDEKVMGTAHIALGNNMSMGGTCNVGIHVDGVFFKPTIKVDDRVILNEGNLILE